MSRSANERISVFVHIMHELPEVVDVVPSELLELESDEAAAVGDSGAAVEDEESSSASNCSLLTSLLTPWVAENKGTNRNTRNIALKSILKHYFSVQKCHLLYTC